MSARLFRLLQLFHRRITRSNVGVSIAISTIAPDNNFSDRENCDGSNAQRWVMNDGITEVRLNGTNLCLDSLSSQWLMSFYLSL